MIVGRQAACRCVVYKWRVFRKRTGKGNRRDTTRHLLPRRTLRFELTRYTIEGSNIDRGDFTGAWKESGIRVAFNVYRYRGQ